MNMNTNANIYLIANYYWVYAIFDIINTVINRFKSKRNQKEGHINHELYCEYMKRKKNDDTLIFNKEFKKKMEMES